MTLEDLNALDGEALARLFARPPEEVASLLRIAAEGGAVAAQVALGQVLLDGRGVAIDRREAARWFSHAAKAGDTMAMNMLGRCFEHGWGMAQDKARAAEWYGAAAARGLDWGLYNLATALTLGEGVAQDHPRALGLFRQAAALGHAKSMNMVGGFHEDGWVVPRNMAEAGEWFRRAAEGGDFRGMFNHARMLIEAGRLDDAGLWLKRLPGSATQSFIDKARTWLDAHCPGLAGTLQVDRSGSRRAVWG